MLNSEVTQDIADEIRKAYVPGVVGHGALSKSFGVSESMVRNIVLGRVFNKSGVVPRKPWATPEKEQRMRGKFE